MMRAPVLGAAALALSTVTAYAADLAAPAYGYAAPAYVAPAPVYAAPPIYTAPIYAAPPVYVAPAPVYTAPLVSGYYAVPPAVVSQPIYDYAPGYWGRY